ncbi:MAG: efflux RND transporter permease subunit [Fusobacteriota bacterium]
MKKVLKYPWIIIGIILVITTFFAIQLPSLRINNEVEIFLPDDHPSIVKKEDMEEEYGGSEMVAMAMEVKKEDILTKENIKIILDITKKIEDLKNIDEVTSLTNSDYIKGTVDGMEVGDLVKEMPQNEEDVLKVKEKLISWREMYEGNLFSENFKATQIMAKLKQDISIEEKEEVYYQIKDISKEYKSDNTEFYISGMPAVTVLMGNSMQNDVRTLIPFVLIVVLISLYLSFKNAGGVILPTLTVLISTIWALGLMALLGINLTMVSTVIPVLLVAVGSAYGIHIISHYYDDIKKQDGKISEEKHRELVLETVKKVGKAVILAGLTTIAGFGSLATSEIVPIKTFGIFTAIGVGTALIVAITLIPSILLIRHKKLKINKDEKDSSLTKLLMVLYHYFSKKKVRIVVLTISIIIVSAFGIKKIIIDSVMVEMFKDTTEIRVSDKFLNDNFNGTNVLGIMIDGEDKGSLTNPEILKSIEGLEEHLIDNFDEIKKITSFPDFLKRMNKVMNYPQEDEEVQEEASGFDSGFSEGTTDFGSEETSSFGEESFDSESSFYEEESETTSSFGQEEEKSKKTQNIETQKQRKPSNEKMTEKEMVKILNEAVIKASKLNLTGEELINAINKELNYKGEAYNEIPYNPEKYPAETRDGLKNLISQYLLLYSGSLDSFINDQLEPSGTKLMVQITTASNIVTQEVKDEIDLYVKNNFPKGYDVEVAGAADMALSVNNLIVSSQLKSIAVSLIVVFLVVGFAYKSMIAGIFGIIPLAISLLINFGLMGYLGIRLDIGTAMVASIAIGIGVDYTIHFLSTYNHERQVNDDLEVVTKNTLVTSGKAIIFNAVSVGFGFAVLLFSNFNPIKNLGLLVSITMITSSLASMTVLPVLLNIFKPKFIKK